MGDAVRGMDRLPISRAGARRHQLRHLSRPPRRPRSNTSCATAARRSSSPRTRSTSTRCCPFVDRLPALRCIVVIDTSAHVRLRPLEAPALRPTLLGEASADDDAAIAALEALAASHRSRATRRSSSTPRARPAIRRARSSPTAGISPAPTTSSSTTRYSPTPQRTVVYLPLCHVLGPRRRASRCRSLSRAGAALRRGRRGPRADALRGGAHGALHRAALSAEVRLAGPGRACRTRAGSSARAYDAAMRVGRRHARARWDGRAARRLAAGLRRCARRVVFRPLLNKLGFDALELVISGGAPLPPETMALWQIWGVNVCEIYGQTEEAGAHHHRPARARSRGRGTSARSRPGWELQLAESGEILIRGEHVFEGYWGNPAATREVQAEDGWLHTGDVGEWKDGRLRLIDRARDFIVTAGGKTLVAVLHREHPARQPLRRRGRGLRARAQVPDRARRDRLRHRVRLGARPRHRVHRLHQSRRAPRGARADRRRDRARQRAARARRAGQGVPHPAEGARSGGGGRADHADAQGEARADVRALRRPGRVDVRPTRGAAARRATSATCCNA